MDRNSIGRAFKEQFQISYLQRLLRHPLFLESCRSPCSGQREWSGFSQIFTLIFTSGQGHLTNLLLIALWHMHCQNLWQGRHLLVPSCIHFTIWIHGCRWLLSHILSQMLWRMRGGRASRARAGQVGQTLIKLHSGLRNCRVTHRQTH